MKSHSAVAAVFAIILIGSIISLLVVEIPSVAGLGIATVVIITVVVLMPARTLLVALLLTIPAWTVPLMPTGILSRLYIGNIIMGVLMGRWMVGSHALKVRLPDLEPPLTWLCLVSSGSLVISLVSPVTGVVYDFPHESVPRWITALTQLGLLGSIWVAPRAGAYFAAIADQTRVWLTLYAGAVTSSVIVIISSVLQTGSGVVSILGHARPATTLYDGVIVVLPFMVNQIFGVRRYRAMVGAGIVLCVAAAAVSFSRTVWVWAVVAVTVPILMNVRRRVLWTLGVGFLAGTLGVTGAFEFYNPERVYGLERTYLYEEAWSLFVRHPLTGVGSGNYQFFSLADPVAMQGGIAHNQVLTALAESGVLVIPVLLCLLVGVVRYASGMERDVRPGAYGLALAWLSSWFFSEMALPTAAAGGGTRGAVFVVFTWLVLGLLVPRHRSASAHAAQSLQIVTADVRGGLRPLELPAEEAVR